MKNYILVLTTVFIMLKPSTSMGQQAVIDSLTQQLEVATATDSTRIKTLNKLAEAWGRKDPVTSRAYAVEAVTLAKETGNTKLQANATYNVGVTYQFTGKPDSALFYYTEARELFASINNLKGIAQATSGIGIGHAILGDQEKAAEVMLSSLPVYEEMKDSVALGLANYNLGNLYHVMRLNEEALARVEKALGIYQSIGAENRLPTTYALITSILMFLDERENVPEYIEKGLILAKKYEDVRSLRALNKNAGRFYLEAGEYEKSKEYYNVTLEYYGQYNSNRESVSLLYDIARLNYFLGEHEEAASNLKEVISSIEDGHQGMETLRVDAYDALAKNEFNLERYEDAYITMRTAKIISDSLYKVEIAETVYELETKYESEKKEAQIELLEVENEAANLRFVIGLIIAGIIIISIVWGFVWYQRKKAAEKKREVNYIKAELEQYGTLLAEKNNFMSVVKENLASMNNSVRSMEARKELNALIDSLHHNVSLSENEDELFKKIEHINAGFFRELREKSQEISTRDERLASLVKMNLSNKDIANILNIEPKSVKQAKYRLKKKLELSPETDLQIFLSSLAA